MGRVMKTLCKANRNRSNTDHILVSSTDDINNALRNTRSSLLKHPIYDNVQNLSDLAIFMKYHIFAVWDFMSLLKALQINLSCVSIPWVPNGDPTLRRLVNEIVLAEETDEDGKGGYSSHFELYLHAMKQCGTDTTMIDQFLDQIRKGISVKQALLKTNVPDGVYAFVTGTFDIIEMRDNASIAAAFTFGREDVIPDMFQRIVDQLSETELKKYDQFLFYLDRHIGLDSDEHGPMAYQMVEKICEQEIGWQRALDASRKQIESRIRLWDAALEEITLNKSLNAAEQGAFQVLFQTKPVPNAAEIRT